MYNGALLFAMRTCQDYHTGIFIHYTGQEFNICSIMLVMDIISIRLMNRMSVFSAPGNILLLTFKDSSTSHNTEINISQGYNTHQTNACGRPVNTWLKDWWIMMAVGRPWTCVSGRWYTGYFGWLLYILAGSQSRVDRHTSWFPAKLETTASMHCADLDENIGCKTVEWFSSH